MAEYRRLDVTEVGDVTVVRFRDQKILDDLNIQELGRELSQLVEVEGRAEAAAELLGRRVSLQRGAGQADHLGQEGEGGRRNAETVPHSARNLRSLRDHPAESAVRHQGERGGRPGGVLIPASAAATGPSAGTRGVRGERVRSVDPFVLPRHNLKTHVRTAVDLAMRPYDPEPGRGRPPGPTGSARPTPAHHWVDHDIFSIHLALEEALVNAIKHGNGLDLAKQVRVRCRMSDDLVQIEIADEGEGFDPTRVPDPTDEHHRECPNGRGVMLMRSFMDRVEYNERGNCVLLEKRRTKTRVSRTPCSPDDALAGENVLKYTANLGRRPCLGRDVSLAWRVPTFPDSSVGRASGC